MHATKKRLMDVGLKMLLQHGYGDLGIQPLLTRAGVPKGSFYHHFKDKEDFALQVVDAYMSGVHAGLGSCLEDQEQPPLARIRTFFEQTQKAYNDQGYLGCLLGSLGQELSGVNARFRLRIEDCLREISGRIARCLEEARRIGDIPADCNVKQLSELLVDCWEGAALRSRLQRSATSLDAMLDFYFAALAVSDRLAGPSLQDRNGGASRAAGVGTGGVAPVPLE
jgi:TetR/AcrR family transcriptional regulator, transcriptional repressor for nem operon